MGDMAIFVSYDSADVWANKEIFELDEHYKPTAVSGVPPDYFSATGQRWGNPLYRWRYLEQHGFDWWIARVKRQLELYDLLRLDHFRGFQAYWRIPAEEETAMNGEWIEAPGFALFDRLKAALGGALPLIAEDLGVITDKVDKLRCDFGLPGMRVLQFGFAGRGAHLHLPHKYDRNTVCYTGTHDNDTTLGWWMSSICILPVQDLLHLGDDGRMNTPGAPENNWTWRYHTDALHPDLSLQLRHITEECDRDAYVPEEALDEMPAPPEALHDQSGDKQGSAPEL